MTTAAKPAEKATAQPETTAQPEFRDPPPSRSGGRSAKGGGVWMELLEPLLAHPGRWAIVRKADNVQKASGMAAALRKEGAKIPAGKWEFAARQGDVYARFVGPE